MPGSKNNEQDSKVPSRGSGDDSEDESEILEESPCGRWLKRREEVQQRDIPGVDVSYLAMDTEEGVEVVWNEVKFSERKNFNLQEEKIRQVFDNLTQLEHPNIVKFHKYWIDNVSDKPRVIFITEYMSSGSLKQFLKKTKRNVIKLPIQAWKRWCTQILSALSYLHSCSPPVIHGNLTCDTIFIQHNGLVKIGSVAPDAIHRHVKTFRSDIVNVHFIAPEYGISVATPALDIYSFGMCALEMAALEIPGNGDSGMQITEEIINKTIQSLENTLQKDFIKKCLRPTANERPSAKELLFHPVIYEVHPLKLLAAHVIVHSSMYQPDQLTDEAFNTKFSQGDILAEIDHRDGRPKVTVLHGDSPRLEAEKLLEDVSTLEQFHIFRNGIYPLTAFESPSSGARTRTASPEVPESVKSSSPELLDVETRRIINMICDIKQQQENHSVTMTLLLRMDDKMNRQLSCEVSAVDTPIALAEELVHHGLINQNDRDMVSGLMLDTLSRRHVPATRTQVAAS